MNMRFMQKAANDSGGDNVSVSGGNSSQTVTAGTLATTSAAHATGCTRWTIADEPMVDAEATNSAGSDGIVVVTTHKVPNPPLSHSLLPRRSVGGCNIAVENLVSIRLDEIKAERKVAKSGGVSRDEMAKSAFGKKRKSRGT